MFTLYSTFHQNTYALGNNQQLTQHSSIQITSDADLKQVAKTENWKGDGTEKNPIMIQRYIFSDQPIVNSAIFTEVSNNFQYLFRGFTSFNLILTNISLYVKIESNNFNSSVLIVNSGNITINANSWVNQWNPNNLFIATTWQKSDAATPVKDNNIRITDNTFFGSNEFCTIEGDFRPSPRVVLYGGGFTIHHNIFEMDVGCYPTQNIFIENTVDPLRDQPTKRHVTSITNNLFKASDYAIISGGADIDISNNDFEVGDFAIIGFTPVFKILHNNFYVSHLGNQGKQNYTDVDFFYSYFYYPRDNPLKNGYYGDATWGSSGIIGINYYSNWVFPDRDNDGIVDRPLNNVAQPFREASTKPFPGYDEVNNDNREPILQIVIGTIIGLLAVGFGLKKIDSAMQSRKVIYDGDLHGTPKAFIKELFQSQTLLYYTLVGQSRLGDKDLESNIRQGIPRNILEFKFLLHPLRLSMTKLLYENLELSSVDIKDILNISWNDYTTHTTALKKKGYINVTDRFIEGNKRQILTLEPKGIQEYKVLLDLLHLFLDNSTDLNAYIQTAQQRLEQSDPDLYPNA